MADATPTKDEHPIGNFSDDENEEPYPSLIPDNECKLLNQQPTYDKLIQAQVQLPQHSKMKRATVKGWSVNSEGKTTGTFDGNPYLNSVIYDVEFRDGEHKQYSENMYSKVDADGHSINLLHFEEEKSACFCSKSQDASCVPQVWYWSAN